MIRKTFCLMLCILFIFTIITACASPTPTLPVTINTTISILTSTQPLTTNTTIPIPTSTQPVATNTSLPSPTHYHTATPSPTKVVPVHPGTLVISIVVLGYVELNLIQTDGTGLTQLTHDKAFAGSPAWSPDGNKIVYGIEVYPEPEELWVMNANGSGQTQVTHDPIGGFFPAWSPDGNRVAYSSIFDSIKNLHTQIYVVNADGSNQRQVTNGPESDLFPQWTSDGKILFLRKGNPFDPLEGDIYAVNPNGSGLVRLTTMGDVGYFALSPDGTKIAIHDLLKSRIEILPLKAGVIGTPVTLVDSDFGYDFVQIAWSPDGQALAMARMGLTSVGGHDVYVVNADGSGLTIVPHTDAGEDVAWRPNVSPALDTTPSSTSTQHPPSTPTNTPEPP